MSENDKFDWKATESAPKNYPMEVISGTFLYRGAPDGVGLYVPAGKTLYYGWGQMVSSHLVGPDLKPLPDRLEITFFSFLENQHYQGTFDLPYDDILAMFREGENPEGDPTYDRIMVGVAPGGTVAVWLMGVAKTTEVFLGKADPVDLDLMAFGEKIRDRDAYVQAELEDTIGLELAQDIIEGGIPFEKWSSLRRRYPWQPVLAYGDASRRTADIKYFNGEFDRLPFPVGTESLDRAVPQRMQFTYRSPTGWSYLYIIHFDEEETTTAFQELGSDGRSLALELYPEKPIHSTEIRLSNGDESITLKKFHIEDI